MARSQFPMFTVPGCRIALLGLGDEPALQALLERSADYSLLATGAPPRLDDARRLLASLPPGKTPADKFVWGIYQPGTRLVGVLDAVRDYSQAGDWWIGLLLFDPVARRQGLGRMVHQAWENGVRTQGARRIIIIVYDQNLAGLQFWRSLGFEEVERRAPGEGVHVRSDLVEIVQVKNLEKGQTDTEAS